MSYAITLVTMGAVLLMAYFGVDTRASLALVVFAALVLVVLRIRKQ